MVLNLCSVKRKFQCPISQLRKMISPDRQYVQYRSPKIERRNTITRKMMLNMFPYVYRIFQRICLIKSDILLLIITYLFVLFLPQAKNLKTFFVFLGCTIRNIVLALDALFVPVFAITVTVKCWDACTK